MSDNGYPVESHPFLHLHFLDNTPPMLLDTTDDTGVTLHGYCGVIVILAACGHVLLDTYQTSAYEMYLETRALLSEEGNPMGTELSADWFGKIPNA